MRAAVRSYLIGQSECTIFCFERNFPTRPLLEECVLAIGKCLAESGGECGLSPASAGHTLGSQRERERGANVASRRQQVP